MNAAVAVFVAVVALVGFVMFSSALRRWPAIGGFACALGVLTAWELPDPPPILNVSGNNVFLMDIIALAFFVVAASRLNGMVLRMGAAGWAWAFLGVLIVGSFCFGIVSEPLGQAVNEFRSYFYVYAAFSWAMTLDWNAAQQSKAVIRAGSLVGWGLVAVAAYHYALYGFGSTSTFVDPGTGVEQTTRPLVSGQALVLLMCSITTLWHWYQTKRAFALFSVMVFVGVVVASQQRTVWAVALTATAVTFLFLRVKGKIFLVFVGVSAALIVAVLAEGPASGLIAQLANAALDQGTYDARVTGWSALVDQQFGLGFLPTLIGQPMGAGFGRFEGVWVEFAPHNWYVTIFLRTGIIGLLLLAFVTLWAAWRSVRRSTVVAALAIFAGLGIYGWTYSWPWYLCIAWGWAINETLRSQQADLSHGEPNSLRPAKIPGRYLR